MKNLYKQFLIVFFLLAISSSMFAQNWDQIIKLSASDRQDCGGKRRINDRFGYSVAVDVDYAVVGSKISTAYIFYNNAGTWQIVKEIYALDREKDNEFGYSVAISGDNVVIGAYRESYDALGGSRQNNAGAVYIFNKNEGGANNWGQVKKIVASDRARSDKFGKSVSISGDNVIVGAYMEDHDASNSNLADNAGSAYIFSKNVGGVNNWGQIKKIVASDRTSSDLFGYSVAISGDNVVVGAYNDNEDANNLYYDYNSGSAYIFSKDQGGANNWGQVKKIAASDRHANDWFGFSVAISGDNVVVGAFQDDKDANNLNNKSNSGSAYIFSKDKGGANNWGQVKKIVAGDRAVEDNFGYSVSISGDNVIVGAYMEDHDAANTNYMKYAGSAYIFSKDVGGANNWGQGKKIVASDRASSDLFGRSVSISGDNIFVGAYLQDSDVNGLYFFIDAGSAYIFNINEGGVANWGQKQKVIKENAAYFEAYYGNSVSIDGDYAVVGANNIQAAYVLYNNAGSWQEIKKIEPSDKLSSINFGISVSISGDIIVVGDNRDSKDAAGAGNIIFAGSVYIFSKNQGGANNWGQVKKIVAGDRALEDQFGYSVSISGDNVIVGACFEDENATGGDFTDNAGSAYIFNKDWGGTNNWGQVKKIVASQRFSSDFFGQSVSISNDNIVVGAYLADYDANNLNYIINSGSAYVFSKNEGGVNNWGQVKKIVSLDRSDSGLFGYSVAISGENIVVGAYCESNDAAGGNAISKAGAAYIFNKNEGNPNNWGLVKKIVASERSNRLYFGKSVSISGNNVIVGTPFDNLNATDGRKIQYAGSAYIFSKDKNGANNWGQVNKIVATDRNEQDYFGNAVSISGDNVIVGAYVEDEDALGLNTLDDFGSAYIFHKVLAPITMTTTTATSITTTTALLGGNITANGSTPVISRGVCWSTNANPTIANSKTINGTGIGGYTSTLSNLAVGVKYYYRAYATNITGTYYGVEMNFTTKIPPTFTAFADVIDTGNEDTEIEITFAELTTQGNEASTDGTVTAFVVKTLTSGTLKIGTNLITAIDYAIGSNDNIIAGMNAYWTPAKDANGTFDAFAVVAKDNFGATSNVNVTAQIAVTAVNDAPTLTAFATTVANGIEETEAEITFTQLVAQGNESDIDGTVDAFVVKEVKNGTLKIGTDAITATVFAAGTNDIINATNKAFWTPIKDANGTLEAFAVVAKDNNGLESSENITVLVAVANVNDVPFVSAISKSLAEDNILSFSTNDFANSFTDIDGDEIVKILIKSLPSNGILKLNNVIISLNDEISASNINDITFVPTVDWYGSTKFIWNASDAIVYAENDNVVNISICPVNDQPIVANASQTISCNEDDASVAIADIVVTDVDANEEITVNLTLADITAGRLTKTSGNGEKIMAGSLMWTITGSVANVNAALAAVEFVPTTNYDQNTTISVLIEDGKEDGVTAITSIIPLNITAVNDAPTSQNNELTLDEDTQIALSANSFVFEDVDTGDNLTMIKITTLPLKGKLLFNDVVISKNQEIAISEVANLKFAPDADGFGLPYTLFQFKVKDVNNTYSVASYTFTINVKQIDDPTIAVDDIYQPIEDVMFIAEASKNVLINDIDKDDDNLTVSLISNVQHGTLTLFSSGSFAYKPVNNFNGDDSFTYQINDGTSNSNIATVALKVLPANDRPQAAADFYQTQEDVQLVVTTGGVLANDSDIDTDDNLTAILQIAPSNGTLNLNADGTFTYTPNSNFYGNDKFYYSVNDASGNSVVTPVTIRVKAVNDAPVLSETIAISGLNFATSEDGKIEDNLLLNIKDVENGNLIVKLVSGTSIGQLLLNSNGIFSYVPTANISGSDNFIFKVFDGLSYSDPITVNITVNSVNDAPIATEDVFNVNEDRELIDNVVLNDNDPENDVLTVELTKDVANGTLTLNVDGTFTYTPKANFYGNDSFAYKVKDGDLYSNIIDATITVLPVNDEPTIITPKNVTVEYGKMLVMPAINIFDIDNLQGDVEVTL